MSVEKSLHFTESPTRRALPWGFDCHSRLDSGLICILLYELYVRSAPSWALQRRFHDIGGRIELY